MIACVGNMQQLIDAGFVRGVQISAKAAVLLQQHTAGLSARYMVSRQADRHALPLAPSRYTTYNKLYGFSDLSCCVHDYLHAHCEQSSICRCSRPRKLAQLHRDLGRHINQPDHGARNALAAASTAEICRRRYAVARVSGLCRSAGAVFCTVYCRVYCMLW